MHRVRSSVHRRPDADFDTRVAAVEDTIAVAAGDPFPVLRLNERTSHPVPTPIRPDSRDSRDSRDADGRRSRDPEHVWHGSISWCSIQDAVTGALEVIRSTQRWDSTAFVEVLQYLAGVCGPTSTLIMDDGPVHTSRATWTWRAEHLGSRSC